MTSYCILLYLGPEHESARHQRCLALKVQRNLLFFIRLLFFRVLCRIFEGVSMHENSQKFAHLSQLVKIAKFCSAWPRVLPGGSIAPPNVRLNSEKSNKLIYQLLREHRSHLELHGAIFRKNYKIQKFPKSWFSCKNLHYTNTCLRTLGCTKTLKILQPCAEY